MKKGMNPAPISKKKVYSRIGCYLPVSLSKLIMKAIIASGMACNSPLVPLQAPVRWILHPGLWICCTRKLNLNLHPTIWQKLTIPPKAPQILNSVLSEDNAGSTTVESRRTTCLMCNLSNAYKYQLSAI